MSGFRMVTKNSRQKLRGLEDHLKLKTLGRHWSQYSSSAVSVCVKSHFTVDQDIFGLFVTPQPTVVFHYFHNREVSSHGQNVLLQ